MQVICAPPDHTSGKHLNVLIGNENNPKLWDLIEEPVITRISMILLTFSSPIELQIGIDLSIGSQHSKWSNLLHHS